MATKEINVLLSAKDEVSEKLSGVRKKFGTLREAASLLTSALGPLASAMAVKEIIEAAVGWERYELALTTVAGSQSAANQELEWLSTVADQLGLDLQSVVGSYTSLAASAKDTALEGEATRDIFYAVSAAMAKLGASTEQTDGALLAISQMMSKGKISAEELRGQLGERMPGAFNLFAKAAGVSTGELDAMLQAGEVGIDLLPKFATELEKAFDVDVDTRIDSAQAAMNRFSNALLDIKLQVADAGLLDAFVSGLNALQGAISDQGLLENIGGLGEMFSSISDDGSGFEAFLNGLIEVLKVFGIGVMTVVAPVKLLGEIIGATAAALSLAVEGEFAAAKAALMDSAPADKFNADIDRIVAAVDNLGSSFDEVKESAEPAAKELKDLGEASENAAQATEVLTEKQGEQADAVEKAKQKILAKKEAAIVAKQAELELAGVSSDVSRAQAEAAIAAEENAKALKEQKKTVDEVTKSANEMAVELEKIASNERIKSMEMVVDFNIEAMKADAQIATALIDGIGDTISSTNSLISSLTNSLESASNFSDRWMIQDLIEDANDRAAAAAEKQLELADSQISYYEARTKKINSGDALIKITGEGMVPHIRGFMWEMIKEVQIEAASEEAAFLIGLG